MIADIQIGPPPIRRYRLVQDEAVQFLCGDSLEMLRTQPDKIVQTIITSPPYFHARDYQTARWEGGDPACDHRNNISPRSAQPSGRFHGGDDQFQETPFLETCGRCGAVRIDRQIGLERTPEQYVDRLVEVFHEARRVLKDNGVLWLNLGDSYASSHGKRTGRNDANRRNHWGVFDDGEYVEAHAEGERTKIEADYSGLQPGNLLGLPWRVAFAMQADGWFFRQWCPWLKRNSMPESVKSRPTSACEILFMFTKTTKYFYDFHAVEKAAVTSPKGNGKYAFGTEGGKVAQTPGRQHRDSGQPWRPHKNVLAHGQPPNSLHLARAEGIPEPTYLTRRRRNSDWFLESWQGLVRDEDGNPLAFVVNTTPLKELHFAPFPIRLIEPCILSSSRPGDTIMDPFCGSGTVGVAAVRHGRKAILIDLKEEYIEIAKRRVGEELRACERRHGSAAIALKHQVANGIGSGTTPLPDFAYECAPPPTRRFQNVQGGPEILPDEERESENPPPEATRAKNPEKSATEHSDLASAGTGPLISANCLNGIYEALRFCAPNLCHHVETLFRRKSSTAGIPPRQRESDCHHHAIDMHLDDATAILDALVKIEREHGDNRKFYDRQISFLVCVWRERVDQLQRLVRHTSCVDQ
jgi:site-specific DNA-methyltransferase (cytosine-N4-specific)